SRVRYDNELVSTSSIFVDFNTDGRDEALFLPYEAWGEECNSEGGNCQDVLVYDLPGAHYVFSETNTIESKSTTGLPVVGKSKTQGLSPFFQINEVIGGALPSDPTSDPGACCVGWRAGGRRVI
ncbi:MAG: hypothetical protein AAGD12_05460, partial [Pseudomonadota bacterium]